MKKDELLRVENVKVLLRGLDCLEKEVRPGKGGQKPEGELVALVERISALRALLQEAGLCEAGSEGVCESTRIGTFW